MFEVENWYEAHKGNHPPLGDHAAVLSRLGDQPAIWLEKRGNEYFVCAPPDFSLRVDPGEAIRNLWRFPRELRIRGVFQRLVHS